MVSFKEQSVFHFGCIWCCFVAVFTVVLGRIHRVVRGIFCFATFIWLPIICFLFNLIRLTWRILSELWTKVHFFPSKATCHFWPKVKRDFKPLEFVGTEMHNSSLLEALHHSWTWELKVDVRMSGGRGCFELWHSACFSGGFPSRTVTIQRVWASHEVARGDRAERHMTGHLEAELPEEGPHDVTGLRCSPQAIQHTHTSGKNLHTECYPERRTLNGTWRVSCGLTQISSSDLPHWEDC